MTDIDNQGTLGIELMFNNKLAGKQSTFILEKDARSGHFYFKRETKVKGTKGEQISLTIDSNLQFLAYQELKRTVEKLHSKSGSALIINASSGEILVMANYPDFDPNSPEDLVLENTRNTIVSDAYELGSVIKVFLALAALKKTLLHQTSLLIAKTPRKSI